MAWPSQLVAGASRSDSRRRVLIVTTCWWAYVARTAHLLSQAGCTVAVLCPRGHAARAVPGIRLFPQSAFRPIKALSSAIAAFGPSLIIPADDRAVASFHALHGIGSQAERNLVERSIGAAGHYRTTTSRSDLLALARTLGIATPAGTPITNEATLADWMAGVPKPWVLKADGAWAGEGVRIADSPEAAFRAHKHLRRRLARTKAVKRALINRDAFWLADWLRASAADISAQSYIHGRPANLAMFCADGDVLAINIAEVVACAEPTGPSTIIRLVERKDMLVSARKLARALRLNGFHGLDFMIEHGSDRALLIEINPRLTSLSNIRAEAGRDLVGTAAVTLTGALAPPLSPLPYGTLVANFPGAWHWSFAHPNFAECHSDVPLEEPALVAEMLRPAWPERHVVARLCRSGTDLARSFVSRLIALRPVLSPQRAAAQQELAKLQVPEPAGHLTILTADHA